MKQDLKTTELHKGDISYFNELVIVYLLKISDHYFELNTDNQIKLILSL